MTVRVAALDLGTNTFLLLIAEVQSGKITKTVGDHIRVTRLGQGVHQSKMLHPDALKRAEQCFAEYRKIIDDAKVDKVVAVATSAARDAKNSADFFNLGAKYGIPIKVISGDKEAELTFVGSTYDFTDVPGRLAVVDVGGGSTEVIVGRAKPEFGKSLNIGSIRLTEMFVNKHPVEKSALDNLKDYVVTQLNSLQLPAELKKDLTLIGVAGTPTTLSAVMQKTPYSDEVVHKYKMQCSQMESLIYKMASLDLEERKAVIGMDPQRADVIIAGGLILLESARFLGVDHFFVSTRGVRFGIVLKVDELI